MSGISSAFPDTPARYASWSEPGKRPHDGPIQYTEDLPPLLPGNNKAMFIGDTANQGQGCQKRDSIYPTQHFLQVRLYPFYCRYKRLYDIISYPKD